MKLVQFITEDHTSKHRIGILHEGRIIDVNDKFRFLPNSIVELISTESAIAFVQRALVHPEVVHDLHDVKLVAPICKPDKVICIGLNYKGFCDDMKIEYPKEPIAFSKFPSVIIGPHDNIKLPKISNEVDWEAELAVIIGRLAKDVKAEDAMDYVLGYTVAQDISARDWQKKNGGEILLSKSMDTFCPLGPWIVTKEEIEDPYNLNIRSWVNGELKQDANTNQLIHRIDKIIEHLSSITTLYPGDVILTGTPSGVGANRNPPEFLKKGDVLETEIEGIGKITNKVC